MKITKMKINVIAFVGAVTIIVKDEGFDCIEAYPNKEFINVFRDFMGPVDMYRKCGFVLHEETEHGVVMRKQLKN